MSPEVIVLNQIIENGKIETLIGYINWKKRKRFVQRFFMYNIIIIQYINVNQVNADTKNKYDTGLFLTTE